MTLGEPNSAANEIVVVGVPAVQVVLPVVVPIILDNVLHVPPPFVEYSTATVASAL